MTMIQRIGNFIIGIILLLMGIFIVLLPEITFPFITLILGLSLVVYGIRSIVYYFRMARHMVGGRYMLYIGIIVLDFGIFTLSLANIPKIYIVIYLAFINAFSGVIYILRSFEAKQYEAAWKLNFIHGIVNIIIAIACLVMLGLSSTQFLVYVYGAGVIYTAFSRLRKTFQKSAIVYVQ